MIIFEYQKDMELNNEFEKKRLFRMEMESEVTADDVIDVFYDFLLACGYSDKYLKTKFNTEEHPMEP